MKKNFLTIGKADTRYKLKTDVVPSTVAALTDLTDVTLSAAATSQALLKTAGDWENITQIYNVKAYGAVGSGSIDDAAAIQAAIDATGSTGGIIVFPSGSYKLSSGLVVSGTARILLLGYGAVLIPDANVTAITITGIIGVSNPNTTIQGLRINGNSNSNTTGVEICDSVFNVLRDCEIDHLTVGVYLHATGLGLTTWVEGTLFDNVAWWSCSTGLQTTPGKSYDETALRKCGFAQCDVGMDVQSGSYWARSIIDSTTFWINDGGTGILLNGDMEGAHWNVGMEATSGTTAKGWSILSPTYLDKFNCCCTFFNVGGTFGYEVYNPNNAAFWYMHGKYITTPSLTYDWTAQSGGLTTEDVQDIVGAMLIAGSGINLSYNDPAGTLIISQGAVSLLLDSVNAYAAFSVRLLRTAYSGPCLRLRRSTDNAESDFGFSLGWLDVSGIAIWLGADIGTVVTWYDQTGNGHNLSQPTADKQPTYTASGIGAKPSVSFDGSNDVFAISGPTHGFSDWAAAMVFKPTSFTANRALYGGTWATLELCTDTSGNLNVSSTSTADILDTTLTVSTATGNQVWFQRQSNTVAAALNGGAAQSTAYAGSFTAQNTQVGLTTLGGSDYSKLVGLLSEWILWTSAQTNPSSDQKTAFGIS